tara:strand:+ start:795 stop:1010 length:216 start_codon:yes stop_codon:yes gene_type:complete
MVEKPNIPPDSCDHIDRVVELMESLLNGKDPEVNSGYTNIIKEEMEIIRTINIQLRTASKFWYDKSNKKKK